ncbi:Protein mak11 [Coemansia sp. RSA 1290]|nr:Protein mak11 [Coemansia sp. RSA 1290]KAJ2650815.1 60s ribosome biogenesis protein mak11 [Coemansia sp. RSA 1250]
MGNQRKRAKTAASEASSTSKKTSADTNGSGNSHSEVPKAEVAQPEPTQNTFMAIAGTYERLLYGFEASQDEEQVTLKPQFIFPAHIGCIKAVATGGRYLASGSTDEIIRLYDLKKRVELGSLHEHKGTITALQFHGKSHLLSASEDGAICIFRTKDWEPLKVLKGHKGAVSSIAIHPSGKLALSVSQDRTLIVWNLLTGQRASRTKMPQVGEIVAWNPSGTRYIVAYATEVQVYAVGQAESLATVFLRQRILSVLVVSYKDKDYILCGCQDKRIHVYTADGLECGSMQCHENRIKGLSSASLAVEGVTHPVVVSISSDGWVKVWKLADMLDSLTQDAAETTAKPLAKYNADVRLTCLTTSSADF